ncbi:MAG: DUF11 domain-containing protein [Clostridia bacterium]|nr:DUF11 domain-containing protein [Clostridia bacterium]
MYKTSKTLSLILVLMFLFSMFTGTTFGHEEPVYDFVIELTSDPRHLVQGEEATFNIRVENTGNQTLNGILVVEEGLGIYQEITTLDPGREQNITKTKTMNELGQYEVLVRATINMNEYRDEKTAQGSFAVEKPRYDLAVQMVANPETVKLGGEVTFSISIMNTGNIDIQDITVNDSLTGFHETIPLLEVGQEMNFSTSKFMREPGTYRNTAIVRFNAGKDSMVREAVAPVTVQEPEPIYDLEIEKTATPETVELGKEVIYTIRVKNTGNKDLKVIEVEDPKLGISEKIKSLGAGEEKIFTSSAVMNELGTYTNTATASVNMPDVFSKTVRSEAVVTVKSEPTNDVYDFEIEKIATPETVYLGNAATFDITIKNTGNKDLFDIKIVDEMLDINREIALLPAGEEFHDSIDIVMNELGTFTNTVLASVTMGEFSKTETAQAAVMVIPAPEPIYSFEIELTATPDTVYKGEEITYFIKIVNTGNRDIYNMLIEAQSLGFDDTGIIELLKAGEELSGSEPILRDKHGTITSSITASVEMDEYTGTKTAEATVTVLDPARDFTITKTVDDASVYKGETVIFEIVVENIGTTTMKEIAVVDEKIGLNVVIDTLEPGEENSYLTTTAVEMNEIGVYKNTATATWEGISKSDSAEITVMDLEPVEDFIITKTVDDASVYKGETVNFEIVVENIGTKTMNNIVLKDEKIGLNTVIETLEPGEENSYRTTAAIKMDDLCLYKNTAEATWEGISKSASAEVKVSKKYDSMTMMMTMMIQPLPRKIRMMEGKNLNLSLIRKIRL